MNDKQNLLFELGTEELPPKSLFDLSQALLNNIKNELAQADLQFEGASVFATPRRLAVIVKNLSATQADKIIEKRGPALQAAFDDDGHPSKAALGFARSCGVTVEQLNRLKNEKGEWLAFRQKKQGQKTVDLLPGIIERSIHALPVAKRMRWGNQQVEFVRPVHWVVLLFGKTIVKTKILDINAGNETYGHRFHAPQAIILESADEYAGRLYREGRVIADFMQRKAKIRELVERAAQEVGGKVYMQDALLDEITALNEWPVTVTGNFDERYLELPSEVLMTTMQVNQKYFPVFDKSQKLLPHFITISNIESTNPDSIRKGNERVIKPRLADAEFFWNQDRKITLQERIKDLEDIVFQNKLGTMADKAIRVKNLTYHIATNLKIDPALVNRAALLAKTDLLTEMVGEFPSLQGIMGRYYALADGESEQVALALEEQYFPKYSGAPLPDSFCGQILAVAEKIDTLTGIFSVGLIPTGDKDPYALRRLALGVLRILIEKELELELNELVRFGLKQFDHSFDIVTVETQLIDFIYERLRSYFLENGYTADEFESVYALGTLTPLDFKQRLRAVKSFRELPDAENLSSANKRIRNILKKSATKPSEDFSLLVTEEEKNLLETAIRTAREIKPLLEANNYQAALNHLAQLRGDVDNFFENVMVMVDDINLRAARLGLLQMLSEQFLKIADISKLQP